jgi:hypothetical protein
VAEAPLGSDDDTIAEWSSDVFRCAAAVQQASDIIPTIAERKRAHSRNWLQRILGMPIPPPHKDEVARHYVAPGLLIAPECQAEQVRHEFKNQLALHIAGNRSPETQGCRTSSIAVARIVGHG